MWLSRLISDAIQAVSPVNVNLRREEAAYRSFIYVSKNKMGPNILPWIKDMFRVLVDATVCNRW